MVVGVNGVVLVGEENEDGEYEDWVGFWKSI